MQITISTCCNAERDKRTEARCRLDPGRKCKVRISISHENNSAQWCTLRFKKVFKVKMWTFRPFHDEKRKKSSNRNLAFSGNLVDPYAYFIVTLALILRLQAISSPRDPTSLLIQAFSDGELCASVRFFAHYCYRAYQRTWKSCRKFSNFNLEFVLLSNCAAWILSCVISQMLRLVLVESSKHVSL